MKKIFMTMIALLCMVAADAQESTTMQKGGQFMDLLLPMEGSVAATESDWGTAAGTSSRGDWDGTLGRWKDNGIEDTERSYWGGNIVRGDDGKYHIFVAGWPSATCGHMQWSSKSMVYHVTADNVWGPYTYQGTLGTGHNPEIYKTGDTYIIYKIEPLGYYHSTSLDGTWQTGEYTFDLRDRALIAGDNRETSLSNCSFAQREDGSFVMIDRGGGIWVSRDGLSDPWHQLTDASVYLNSRVRTRGSLEDPVIWRDHLQYHMVVNDWSARYAYYYRSLDGLHWVMEDGKAYTGEDPFAKHADGTVERWHKYERPRVYQDEQGRAIRMNFAVIDCVKQEDLAGDSHSSKNINMPLTRQLLLEVLGTEPVTASTTSVRVLVRGEDDFNPRTDLNLSSLRFGSHDKVNYGNGLVYASSEPSGTSDLIITFTGQSGQSGITTGEWAAKMLGQKTDGSVAFGYAKMPGVNYQPAMLSAIVPAFGADGTVLSIDVSNYGQSDARAITVRVYNQAGTTLLAHGTISSLAAYASETVTLTKDAAAKTGYKSIQVRFYDGETLLNTENIPLTAITEAQTALQTLVSEASALYADASLANGKATLKAAIDAASPVAKTYSLAAIAEQQAALGQAVNTFKFANATLERGQSINIENPTMDGLDPWKVTRSEATGDSPCWKIDVNGSRYPGFDGNTMTYWQSPAYGALGYANRASQTIEGLPAGRYRLSASVIACRQNSSVTATTGVTLFLGTASTVCSTKDGVPQTINVDLFTTEAQPLTLGINVDKTTNANWVAWDNVQLTYYGTEDGDIVEEEIISEVYSIDTDRVYNLRHFNTRRPRFMASQPGADNQVLTTNDASQYGLFEFTPVAGRDGYFYVYEQTCQRYLVPSTGQWTFSATASPVLMTPNADYASQYVSDGVTWLMGEDRQHANAQSKNSVEVVYAYADHPSDSGNNWELIAVEGKVPTHVNQTLSAETKGVVGCFSLAGMPCSADQPGLVLQRMQDGTVHKVLNR